MQRTRGYITNVRGHRRRLRHARRLAEIAQFEV